jgi:Rrf2 family protein
MKTLNSFDKRILPRYILDVKVQISTFSLAEAKFMLSQTAEYALRAVAFLANFPDRAHVTQHIAEATHVPSGYLSKVLQSLHHAGLVQARRGLGGGFTLTRSADDITIYDVIQAVDPIQRIRTCPLKLAAHGALLCPLHRKLDAAMESVENAFKGTTLGDLARSGASRKAHCPFPLQAGGTHLEPTRADH